LAFQSGSTAHFAEVEVELVEAPEDGVEIWCPPNEIREWSAPSRLGAADAINALRSQGKLRHPVAVRITRFVGIPTDTDAIDAKVATFIAVARAILPPTLWPRIRHGGPQRWEVHWA